MANTDDEFQITPSEVKQYTDLMILWMMTYGLIEKGEAIKRLEDKNLIIKDNGEYNQMTFHEEPYYWAMRLLLGFENEQWYHDEKLWPPSQEYRDLEQKYYDGDITI
ncbi:MAG: hypothetical protein KDE51_02390 [Anaerolineales bacterium]|nr:hypothetical protein [Anaerolineales bacterium]